MEEKTPEEAVRAASNFRMALLLAAVSFSFFIGFFVIVVTQ